MQTMSASKILKRWSATSNYLGEDFSNYYVLTSFTRDSNVYEVANFIAIARRLSAIEPESDNGWIIARFSHWACGYFYSIFVHENSPLVAEAESIAKSMLDYPIIDEDVLSECESLIKEALLKEGVSFENEAAEMQMISEAPAALLCDSLLVPYL